MFVVGIFWVTIVLESICKSVFLGFILVFFAFANEWWFVWFAVGILKLISEFVRIRTRTKRSVKMLITFVINLSVAFAVVWTIWRIIFVLFDRSIFINSSINRFSFENVASIFIFSTWNARTKRESATTERCVIFSCLIWWCCSEKTVENGFGRAKVVWRNFANFCFSIRKGF